MPAFIIEVPRVVRVQCRYCSRYFLPQETVQLGPHVSCCVYCHAEQQRQMERFSAVPQTECQECGMPFAGPGSPRDANYQNRMTLSWKDGRYQLLCTPCHRRYVQRRKDLFGGTPFGRKQGL